jgi:hypothetical protein
MTSDGNDPILYALRRLTVLEPEPARSARVRQRCRAALVDRRLQRQCPPSRRSAAAVLESGLTYGLSIGYLLAMIGDLLRIYVRR